MLKYNLCLIRQGSRILLLNRERNQWMGCWNGVGGKLEPQEEPRRAMLREIREETGISSLELQFKGFLTWSRLDGSGFGGLYFYLGQLDADYQLPTPLKTDEGILDWKELDWILHPGNLGVAHNLPQALDYALGNIHCFDHHSVFNGNVLVSAEITQIDAELEHDTALRQAYLQKYLVRLRKVSS